LKKNFFGKCELILWHDQNVVDVYNKMYVGYKVTMEWGIGGMKWKWKWLMKHFDSTKSKYGHYFVQ
jgi:hypothetical protein